MVFLKLLLSSYVESGIIVLCSSGDKFSKETAKAIDPQNETLQQPVYNNPVHSLRDPSPIDHTISSSASPTRPFTPPSLPLHPSARASVSASPHSLEPRKSSLVKPLPPPPSYFAPTSSAAPTERLLSDRNDESQKDVSFPTSRQLPIPKTALDTVNATSSLNDAAQTSRYTFLNFY
jgi:hypothetical protein